MKTTLNFEIGKPNCNNRVYTKEVADKIVYHIINDTIPIVRDFEADIESDPEKHPSIIGYCNDARIVENKIEIEFSIIEDEIYKTLESSGEYYFAPGGIGNILGDNVTISPEEYIIEKVVFVGKDNLEIFKIL